MQEVQAPLFGFHLQGEPRRLLPPALGHSFRLPALRRCVRMHALQKHQLSPEQLRIAHCLLGRRSRAWRRRWGALLASTACSPLGRRRRHPLRRLFIIIAAFVVIHLKVGVAVAGVRIMVRRDKSESYSSLRRQLSSFAAPSSLFSCSPQSGLPRPRQPLTTALDFLQQLSSHSLEVVLCAGRPRVAPAPHNACSSHWGRLGNGPRLLTMAVGPPKCVRFMSISLAARAVRRL